MENDLLHKDSAFLELVQFDSSKLNRQVHFLNYIDPGSSIQKDIITDDF